MARHLIQNAATGESRIVGDAALPFFPGFVIRDTLDDGQPPFAYPTTAEGDFRYVNVTELSDPASAASVALKAAFVPQGAPAYAPATRLHTFDPRLSVYNRESPALRKARTLIARSQTGTERVQALGIGHSYLAGSNATPGVSDVFTSLKKYLRARLGSEVRSGVVNAVNNMPGLRDSRFTAVAAGWSALSVNDQYLTCTTAGAAVTFVSDDAGTVLDIVTFANSGDFTYSIDGGAAVTVAKNGGTPVVRIVTVTGLANTTHTVTITASTTSQTYLVGVGVRQPTGLELVNFGVGASTTTSWTATAQSHNRRSVVQASAPLRSIVFLQLDTNDARTAVSVSSWKTNMRTIITDQVAAGSACILALSVDAPGVDPNAISTATWNAYGAAHYELADEFDLPLLDTRHVVGGWSGATADGIVGDTLHLNAGGWSRNAGAMGALLAP